MMDIVDLSTLCLQTYSTPERQEVPQRTLGKNVLDTMRMLRDRGTILREEIKNPQSTLTSMPDDICVWEDLPYIGCSWPERIGKYL